MYLEITDVCNLSCSFCAGCSRPPRFMTAEEFSFLTDRLRGKCTYLYFHLMGEPLLHPLFPAFVTEAAEKGFRPMLTTNGTLLDERADEILNCGLYKISISLHSMEANEKKIRTEYLDSCFGFAKRAAERGIITVFRLWNLDGKETKGENSLNAPILSAMEEAFPLPWRENRSGKKLADFVYLEWGEKFEWPDANGRDRGADRFCSGLRDHIGVLCDGTVVPCCLDHDGTAALGNLFSDPLDRILTSPRAEAIREGFSRHCAVEDLCRRCGFEAKI